MTLPLNVVALVPAKDSESSIGETVKAAKCLEGVSR